MPNIDASQSESAVLRTKGSGAASPTLIQPRPFVLRSVVDRRKQPRRSAERAALGHARTITQSDPEEMLALDTRLRLHFDTEIERARSEAYEKGHTEGRAEAIAATNQVATAIGLSTAQLMDFSERDREIAVAAVIELAERIATLILNGTPHDAGLALLGQIREVLMDLDDAPFVVAVHPDDLDIVSAGVDGESVTIAADQQLQPGEARIRGAWSYSDLTNSTAWESVLAALNQDPST